MSLRPFDYILKVTGDCENLGEGAVYIEPIGGVPPYDINWIFPSYPIASAVTSTTKTGLSVGYYQMLITDSSTTNDNELFFLFSIGQSFCTSILATGTTCNTNNGFISVSADTTTNNVEYYLYNISNILIQSASTSAGTASFTGLSPDVYYVFSKDEGGCTARTQTCSIKPSTEFDYDFFVVDNSQCFNATGRIFVINQNSVGPYTYSWSSDTNYAISAQTTQSISGLTSGQYTATVTDSLNCSISKTVTVNTVPQPSFVAYDLVSPNCNWDNGQITFYLTGGTVPIKYFLSNGASQVVWDRQVTFSNLTVGNYSVVAVDAGKCTATTQVFLGTLDAFDVTSVQTLPSTCNSNDGSIIINIVGGAVPYTVFLYDLLGGTLSQTTSSNQIIFNNLPSGQYRLFITNPSDCFFEQDIFLINEDKFTLSTDYQDTLCGEDNGIITLTVSSGGTAPFLYQVGNQIKTSTSFTQTFTNLSSGVYTVSVTDNYQCSQSSAVLIKGSEPVEFTMIDSACLYGNDATITLLISQGVPPFTIDWSPNVGAQTGIYVTGLTEGEYFAVVTDANGCKLKKTTKIFCGNTKTAFKKYTLCEDIFKQTSNSIFGVSQLYAQGFQDITSGSACTLNFAIFELEVIVGATSDTFILGTYYSFSEYPTDQQIADAIENLLENIPGIGSVVIDIKSNTISINTDCDKTISADTVTINLNITYDFCCLVTTTTTCDNCRKYRLETTDPLTKTEFIYTPCDSIPFYRGNTNFIEFCADSTQNIYYASGAILTDLGCCECNNSAIQMQFHPNLADCFGFKTDVVVYVSGNTLPLNLGDFIYTDMCLTESAESGNYFDFYNDQIIYYYNQFNGIYKIVQC